MISCPEFCIAAAVDWSVTPIDQKAGESPLSGESGETSTLSDYQAQTQLNQAMANYFQALQSGSSKSASEREALWDKIVSPAEKRAQETQNKIFQSQRRSSYSDLNPTPEISSKPDSKPESNPDTQQAEQPEKYQDRPTFELDGSAIPKEIIFPETESSSKKIKRPQTKLKKPRVLDPHLLDSDLIPIYQ